MSDKEKAFVVLQLAAKTCSATLKALQTSDTIVQIPESLSKASLDTKLDDFNSLLSLLYQNTTKLAIALKPSSVAYTAAITPAKELTTHADAFASCAHSIYIGGHGRTIGCEVRWSAEDILGALEALLGVYTSEHPHQGDGDGTGGNQYLVRTGVVHEAIDRARGISRKNREAVKKRWEGILGGLGDCEKEVEEMIEEEEEEDDEGEMGAEHADVSKDGNGWEELISEPISTEPRISASSEELARLKNTQGLLKFTCALMERIDLVILRPPSLVASPPPRTLDEILASADALLRTTDELVHALYIPQDSGAVSIKSKDLVALVDKLRSELSSVGLVTHERNGQGDDSAIADLAQRTAGLNLNKRSSKSKEKRWFDTCFNQIFKSAEHLA